VMIFMVGNVLPLNKVVMNYAPKSIDMQLLNNVISL
jgi:hypothetical protein